MSAIIENFQSRLTNIKEHIAENKHALRDGVIYQEHLNVRALGNMKDVMPYPSD